MIKYPFKILYSIKGLIEELERSNFYFGEFKKVVDNIKVTLPQLIEGVETIEEFEDSIALLSPIIDKVIPDPVMKNTMKAIGFPLSNRFYNATDSFKELVNGHQTRIITSFEATNSETFYKICCFLILSRYYHINLNLKEANLLEIDSEKGYLIYLSIIYNYEYFSIYPSAPEYELTADQIDELLNNYENTALWYQYIPVDSWILKGIGIATFFENTTNIAISNLKSKLLSYSEDPSQVNRDVVASLKSVFRVDDLRVGFSSFNEELNVIIDFPIAVAGKSIILHEQESLDIGKIYCTNFLNKVSKSDYYVITDVDSYSNKYPNDEMVKNLVNQGIKSIIIYPLKKGDECLGILEIASATAGVFNRINANQIKEILPLIEESILRYYNELDLQINSYIQTEYTSLHPSVNWKFRNRAKEALTNPDSTEKRLPITFKDVYPFYGEIDVRGSSIIRNACTKQDYKNQLHFLIKVCDELYNRSLKDKFLALTDQLNVFLERIDHVDKIYFEREIFEFISLYVHPEIPKYVKEDEKSIIEEYLQKLDPHTGLYYQARKEFDVSISMLNKLLSNGLDAFQQEAQRIFPHYYERFNTDGIDFNLYVGRSITPNKEFSYPIIKELRYWQLQTLIALEQQYAQVKSEMLVKIDVATLILTSNTTLDIVFKMDEKRFDVDGYNNAKYEIIKKRINKAFVKGKEERINVPGKLCIIYTEDVLKEEYTDYLNILITKGYLLNEIEYLEVEELQGLGGLLAIRIPINYNSSILTLEKLND